MLLSIAVDGTQIKTLGTGQVIYLPQEPGLQSTIWVLNAANVVGQSQRENSSCILWVSRSIQPESPPPPVRLMTSGHIDVTVLRLSLTGPMPRLVPGARLKFISALNLSICTAKPSRIFPLAQRLCSLV